MSTQVYNGTGKKVQLSLAETDYGVSAVPAFTITNTSESMSADYTKKDSATLLTAKSPMERDIYSITAGGSIPFSLRPDFAGKIIKYALGGTDTVSTTGGVSTHSIVMKDSGYLDTFTTHIDRGAAVKKYSGCYVSKLSLDMKMGEPITGSMDLVAKDESNGTINSSLPNPSLKVFRTIGATLKINGTDYDCSSVSFALDNKLQDVLSTFASGLYANQKLLGIREATVDIEVPYSTEVESLDSLYGETETLIGSLAVKIVSASIITGITPYSMTITLNNVSLSKAKTNVGGVSTITTKLNGLALDDGTTEPLVISIDDATTTAY